jgi:hypothetical protein
MDALALVVVIQEAPDLRLERVAERHGKVRA